MTALGVTGGPVDVLAVMDTAERSIIGAGSTEFREQIHEARAAVAELIEAATDAHDFAANTARNSGHNLDRRFYRLRAALSSCGGAK